MNDDGDLIKLARDLPFTAPRPHEVDEMRTGVLAAMRIAPIKSPATRKTWWTGGAAVAAAAVLIAVVTRSGSELPPSHTGAQVTVIGPAMFVALSSSPDEVIRLTDGVLTIAVSPLAAGERCRVIVGDATVEVRGTAFAVEAHADHLVRVAVQHGRVEVRAQGKTLFLAAGEHWEAPVQIAMGAELVAPASAIPPIVPTEHHDRSPPVAAPRKRHEPTATAVLTPNSAGHAFREGLAALQSGNPADAAEAFDRALRIEPAGGVAEDAMFWRATAYVRAKQPDQARGGFERFLSTYPASVRAGEAAAMLGWILIDAGELDRAQVELQRASSDPAPRVRASAVAGLAEVAHRR